MWPHTKVEKTNGSYILYINGTPLKIVKGNKLSIVEIETQKDFKIAVKLQTTSNQ